jgi:subtilisin family serine protease
MGNTGAVRRHLALALVAGVVTAAAGAVLAGPAAAAEGKIREAGTPTVVKDSYVVVLKDSARLRSRGVTASVSDLVSRYGGRTGRTYSHALKGFEVSVGASAAKKMAADADVAYIQKNGVYTIQDTQSPTPSYGLDRIDQRNRPLDNSYTYSTRASNVHAYVIDTGIRFTHTDFGGRATSGRDTVDNDSDATDCNGHGTHVAGTVGGTAYGVAKGVQLVGVRVLDCDGSGTTAQVAAGIDWVTANAIKPAVANMSLGGGVDTTLDNAVANSIASGVSYAVAAGNGDFLGRAINACNTSPARTPNAVTVSATNSSDTKAGFANFGTCVDIFAPGVNITSAWHTGNTATNTISGTSMAAPHVAGAAALVLAANPSFTPAQVTSALTGAATTGVVGSPGTGSPNRLLYTGSGTTPPPPPPPPGCTGTNGTDVAIPDAGAAVTSTITISGCGRSASTTSTVSVDIRHTYRGDLVVDLVAPDGSSYRLKGSSSSDGADNVTATYTANLGSEAADGAWRLRVQDVYRVDTGTINTWTLTV